MFSKKTKLQNLLKNVLHKNSTGKIYIQLIRPEEYNFSVSSTVHVYVSDKMK